MLIKDVRAIASSYGIKTAKLSKAELIRLIQRHEGNFDCFGSAASGYCDQDDCSWREDSIPAQKKATQKKAAAKKKTVTKKKAVAKKAAPKKKAAKKKASAK